MFKKLVVVAAVLCACGVGPAFAAEQPRPLGAGMEQEGQAVPQPKIILSYHNLFVEVSPRILQQLPVLQEMIKDDVQLRAEIEKLEQGTSSEESGQLLKRLSDLRRDNGVVRELNRTIIHLDYRLDRIRKNLDVSEDMMEKVVGLVFGVIDGKRAIKDVETPYLTAMLLVVQELAGKPSVERSNLVGDIDKEIRARPEAPILAEFENQQKRKMAEQPKASLSQDLVTAAQQESITEAKKEDRPDALEGLGIGIDIKLFIGFEEQKIAISRSAFMLFGAFMSLAEEIDEEEESEEKANKEIVVEWKYKTINAPGNKHKVTVGDIKLLVSIAENTRFDYGLLKNHDLWIIFSLAHAAGAMSMHTDEEKMPRSLVSELASEIQRRLQTSNGAAYYELVWEALQNIPYGAQESLAFKGAVLPVMRLPGEFSAMLGEDRIVVKERRDYSWFTRIVDREGKQEGGELPGGFKAKLGEDRIVVDDYFRDERSFARIVDREGKQVGGELPGEFKAKLGEDRIVIEEVRGGSRFTRIVDREGKLVLAFAGEFRAMLGEDRIVVNDFRDGRHFTRIVDREGKLVLEFPGEFKVKLGQDRIVVNDFRDGRHFTRIVDREGKLVLAFAGEFRAMLGEDRIVVNDFRDGRHFTRIVDREGKLVLEFPGKFKVKLGEDRIVVNNFRDGRRFARIVDREGKQVGGELPGEFEAKLGEDRIVVIEWRGMNCSIRIVDREGKQEGVEWPGMVRAMLGEDRIVVERFEMGIEGWLTFTSIIDRDGKRIGAEFPGKFKAVLPNGLLAADNALFCLVPLTFHQHVLFVVLFGVIEQQGGVRSLLRSFVTTPRTLSTVLSNVTFLDIFVSMPDEAIKILHRVHGKALEQIVIGNMIERLKKLFDKVDEFDSCRVDIARLVMLFGVAQDDPLRKQLKKLDEKRRPSFKGTKDSKKETPDYLD